jgi:hypothetical protein
VFEKITDPMTQISEIIREISVFFNVTKKLKSRALIRVTLAVMKDGKVSSLPIWFPTDEPIKASLSALNSPRLTFINAAKQKQLIIIPDIKKELSKTKKLRKFEESENLEDNAGSMICYPVYFNCSSSIPYVISIHCDEPGYFKNEFKSLYQHTLDRFSLRLNVEHSLFIMKETLCGK